MVTKDEQIEECNKAVVIELGKEYPNKEKLYNLNLRELSLVLGKLE